MDTDALPKELETYVEAQSLNKVFHGMISHVLYENPALPLSESHLRVALMKFLTKRLTTLELSSIDVELKSPELPVPTINRGADPEYKRFLEQVEADVAAEAEMEITRRKLFLSYEEIEELSEVFNKFDEDQLGGTLGLNLDQLERAFNYHFRTNSTMLPTVHSYFDAVQKNEDFQYLKFPDFLSLANTMDPEKSLTYASHFGYEREQVHELKQLYLDNIASKDPSLLLRKQIGVVIVVNILRYLGHGPSQKIIADHIRKLNGRTPFDEAGRIDFRELLILAKEIPVDHEHQIVKKYQIAEEDAKIFRDAYDKVANRETGLLQKSDLKVVLYSLDHNIADQDIENVLKEAMEEKVLADIGIRKDPDFLDFIEFLMFMHKQANWAVK